MPLGKIFGFLKKGSKATSKQKGKKGAASPWPSGIRIGLYGHANSGKTVYFTVLNEESKIGRDLQLSITDNATAGEILANYRSLWGVETEISTGTVVDTRGEKKFPEPTLSDKILQFNAILDGERKYPVVTLDFGGRAVSIHETGEQKDKIIDYMTGCNGILFFFDPKVMAAELETKAHVSSFVSMLERLAPLNKKLHVPVGLVITKADILPGFTGENQTVLIKAENESRLAEDYDLFLEKTLADSHVAADSAWAGSVRSVLINLREFLKVIVGRTLNFQIFFISCTGRTPEKIGTDVGRSLYAPPDRIRPVGVKEPFHWLLHAISRARKINALRRVTHILATLSVLWIILFSIPYLYHSLYLLPETLEIEDKILSAYSGNFYNAPETDRKNIINAYREYERSWVIRSFFEVFRSPSQKIRAKYENFDIGEALKQLDVTIARFSAVVRDTSLWPKMNPSDKTLLITRGHESIINELNSFHAGDSGTVLFKRSGRVLTYWDLFTKSILNPSDTATWETIRQQVLQDQNLYASELSNTEKDLGKALGEGRRVTVEKVVAQQAGVAFDDVIERINGNTDPAFRLGKAVQDLTKIRGQLNPTVDAANIAKIDNYIQAAKSFEQRQKFKLKIEKIPDKDHLHVEVVDAGKSPRWAEFSQLFEGDELTIKWQIGDEIHLAYDLKSAPEGWGKEASDRRTFKGKYALFEISGDITFSNVGKTISLSLTPSVDELLPVLK